GAGFAASLAPAAARFARAARDPERAQLALLAELVRANASTAYGKAHGFDRVRDLASFRARVPAVRHEELAPWIERIARGEQGVLTSEQVRMLERTGGSTSTGKLVPYTSGLLADFAAATGPWLFDLHARHPRLLGTSSYWSVSPVARRDERTSGGLPIGFEDDAAYFGPIERFALDRLLAVPGRLARIADVDTWRFETLRRLFERDDLGLVSVWSPTFLTLLMEQAETHLEDLLVCLSPGRATAIRAGLDREGSFVGEAVWPRLTLVSSWTDGPSAAFLPALRRFFPRTTIQPKGLLATEGVVSLPLGNREGSVLAAASHLIELVDVENPDSAPILAHEARVGARYTPLLSTRGGLYRYRLLDVVEVVGRHHALPRLRFVEKLERVADRFGEKIHAAQVQDALAIATRQLGLAPRFALLAPVDRPARYRLYVELDGSDAQLERLREIVEAHLATGHHYAYCVRLGQLAPMDVVRVSDGAATFLREHGRRGRRAGDVKLTCLDPRVGDDAVDWDRAFGVGAGSSVSLGGA
ncbi:MAG: GH3 auxin-responsive promoter family protein, partial [Myxococcales bacterium]|nr:GH3 auxin-responsive promoter family protein [Myxococcales bacterium]